MLNEEPPMHLHIFEEVNSTMDTAKELVLAEQSVEKRQQQAFAVVTRRQLNGRGTRGRSWLNVDGNLFMTVAVPLSKIKIPLHLCPLRIGTLVLPSVEARINSVTSLKWPNDILIEEDKVCGVLIEVEHDFLFAGIGCNLVGVPELPAVGLDAGRHPACIADYFSPDYKGTDTSQLYAVVGQEVGNAFLRWLEADDSAEAVVADFARYMLLHEQTLRPSKDDVQGERVLPLRLNADGTLQVRVVATGLERTLIAEYLW